MIDRGKEFLLAPAQACKVFPGGISLPTYFRYIGPHGVRGVQLESFVCGGKRWTSKEAIDRFIAAQNPDEAPVAAITPIQRRKQSEAARIELQKMGGFAMSGHYLDGDTIALCHQALHDGGTLDELSGRLHIADTELLGRLLQLPTVKRVVPADASPDMWRVRELEGQL